MTEQLRLKKLFEDHYNGNPWLDVNIANTLSDVTAQEASINFHGLNSIWQLTKHLLEWRKTNMKRASDIILHAPSNNFIYEISDNSNSAWKNQQEEFYKVHDELLHWISDFELKNLDKIYEPNQHSYYEHIQGILQHDAYHLGQIVILKRLIRGI